MKIVVVEAEAREKPAFARLAPANEISFVADRLDTSNARALADAEIVSPFVYSELSRQALEQLSSLKLIATRSTGYDHIDADYCRERGIIISNVPVYGENTVAEHVFALLLAISHRLFEAVERARSDRFSPEGLQGFDLAGKTLGVIGTGSIGRHVVRIAKGFGMEVMAFDINPDFSFAKAFGFRYGTFDELLASADIVTLHAPPLNKLATCCRIPPSRK